MVEAQRGEIEEENRLAEEKKVLLELDRIRRIVAAKVIQKMWRAHKARMMLKHKKKRRRRRK